VPLEVHFELARWGERPRGFNTERLWKTRRPIVVFGHEAWTLPRELEVLSLVVHAAKPFHVFNRLSWFVDVAVVCAEVGFDWTEMARVTAEAHRRIAVGVALTCAQRLGVDVPEELVTLPPVETTEGTLDGVLDPARPFGKKGRPRWLAYVLVDDVIDKVRLAATDLVRPTGQIPRIKIAADLAGIAVRGAPALVRARRRSRGR
jgi:hypothetical protein